MGQALSILYTSPHLIPQQLHYYLHFQVRKLSVKGTVHCLPNIHSPNILISSLTLELQLCVG